MTPPRAPRASRLRRSLAAFALPAALWLASPSAALAAPAPVPCTPIGGGKYECTWYPPGDGLRGGALVVVDRTTVGYLHQGRNWIVCQQRGGDVRNAAGNRNHWFGWTTADNGRTGWASALDARGGADYGPFAGVPDCGGRHGSPPAWSGVWGRPPGGPAPAPAPGLAPAPAGRTVTVVQPAFAHSTPYVEARRRTAIAPGVVAAACEARAQAAGPYRNPWWTRLADGRWVNNSYLRGGAKMGLGDCRAPASDARRAPAACAQRYHVLGLRGSGEGLSPPLGMGETVGGVAQRAVELLGGERAVRALSIPYSATSVDVIAQGNLGDFLTSMRFGQDLLAQEIERTVARCAGARIAVIGYSQGAGAASEALRVLSASARRHVEVAVLIADPHSRSGGGDDVIADPLHPGDPARRAGEGILGGRSPVLGPDRVFDVCFRNDIVCDARRGWSAKVLQGVLSPIHSEYKSWVVLRRVLGGAVARRLRG